MGLDVVADAIYKSITEKQQQKFGNCISIRLLEEKMPIAALVSSDSNGYYCLLERSAKAKTRLYCSEAASIYYLYL